MDQIRLFELVTPTIMHAYTQMRRCHRRTCFIIIIIVVVVVVVVVVFVVAKIRSADNNIICV